MTKSLYILLGTALLGLAAVSVLAADIEDCAESDELAEFVEATVSGCTEEENKCPLVRGHNVTISIKFKSKKEVKSVQQIVHGQIASLPVPFPLESPDACQGTGLECPLAIGDHSYHYSMLVKPIYPKVSVKVKWELLNEDKKQIVCIKIPTIIK